MKTLIQCDFDGTITEKDVSYLLLETFTDGSWREMLREYDAGRLTVGAFNRRAFARIKADRKTLVDFVLNSPEVVIRPGFLEMLDYCSRHGLEFVIVSNGEDFYVDAILGKLGVNHIPAHAATSRFTPAGLEVNYISPEGRLLEEGFKEAYLQLFLRQGYRVLYVGNGSSDIYPARRAHHVFATANLLKKCREEGLKHTPFSDLHDVVRELERLPEA